MVLASGWLWWHVACGGGLWLVVVLVVRTVFTVPERSSASANPELKLGEATPSCLTPVVFSVAFQATSNSGKGM